MAASFQVGSFSVRSFQGNWGRVLRWAGTGLAIAAIGFSAIAPRANAQSTDDDTGASDADNPTDITVDTSSPLPPPPSAPVSTTTGNVRFDCQRSSGQYTVFYHPSDQSGQAYPWAIPSAMGGGWSSFNRCQEIARRLESYRPDGLLDLQTDVQNGYNTVCVTTQRVPGCRIVFTVPKGQDPLDTRDRVFQNLVSADRGEMSQGVYAYRGGSVDLSKLGQVGQWINQTLGGGQNNQRSNSIDLRPFLSRKDGGTGAALQSKASTPSTPTKPKPSSSSTNQRRLNPDLFR